MRESIVNGLVLSFGLGSIVTNPVWQPGEARHGLGWAQRTLGQPGALSAAMSVRNTAAVLSHI